jgi:hypothetical protein
MDKTLKFWFGGPISERFKIEVVPVESDIPRAEVVADGSRIGYARMMPWGWTADYSMESEIAPCGTFVRNSDNFYSPPANGNERARAFSGADGAAWLVALLHEQHVKDCRACAAYWPQR